jgi:hypothetical protein
MVTTGGKKKRTPKENVDGRCTSSHDNKKFITSSMEKQREKAFGVRKTATAVKNTGEKKTLVFSCLYHSCSAPYLFSQLSNLRN